MFLLKPKSFLMLINSKKYSMELLSRLKAEWLLKEMIMLILDVEMLLEELVKINKPEEHLKKRSMISLIHSDINKQHSISKTTLNSSEGIWGKFWPTWKKNNQQELKYSKQELRNILNGLNKEMIREKLSSFFTPRKTLIARTQSSFQNTLEKTKHQLSTI